MKRTPFQLGITLACAIVVAIGLAARAEDTKDKRLSGNWSKKEGQLKMEFSDKDVVKFYPHGDKAEFVIVCKYSIDKDGLLKAKITDLDGKAELKEKAKSRLPVGFEFQFNWKINGDTATLANVD